MTVHAPPTCDICSRPLQKLDASYVVIEAYKKEPRGPFVAHADCFDDGGCYIIQLARITERGDRAEPHRVIHSLAKWRAHLQEKWGWDAWIDEALVRGHRAARALLAPPPALQVVPPASVQATAVRLTPRTKSSPRHPEREKMTSSVRARVLERDGFRCRRCGATAEHARLVVDHVLPIARGGTTVESNLQTLCDPCNSGKHDRAPHAHDLEARGPWPR